VEYHKQNGTVEVLGNNKKKNPQLTKWGNYARRTAIAVLTNRGKSAEFTIQQCKMLVDIGLVPLQFYQYGLDDSDKVGTQQDSTIQNVTETLTYTPSSVTQSLEAITMNMTQFVASMSSKMANDNTTGNKTQSLAVTARNVAQSLAATTINVDVDDDDRKPAAVVIDTAPNVTQPLEATAGNKTQSLADTARNVNQSLASRTSDVTVDDDDRKPEAVLFEATAGNKTQSPAATASNVAQSLAATTSDVAQSTVAIASDVAQSLAAMASNVAQSAVADAGNKKAELACFSPTMIAEDAAAREMVLEQPPLLPQVIETLLSIFHPIICLQLLTILPFIRRWLQMIRWQENFWKKIAKQTPFSKSLPRELQYLFFLTQMPINLQCRI
jgi:hypothetical protein